MKHRINILFLAFSVSVVSFLFQGHPYYYFMLAGCIFLFLIILSLGVLFMRFNYFLKAKLKLNSQHVLLSFDDGPDPKLTPIILDVLKKHDIRAIFFIIGKKAEEFPHIVKRIHEEGHIIGNHSYSHNNFMSLFPRKKLKEELVKSQKVISDITGNETRYFRPPIGYTNPVYSKVLAELNLKCIGWSFRSYDSVYKQKEKLINRLIKNVAAGQIILLHDKLKVSAEALDEFVTQSKSNGIIFASGGEINSLLND